MHPSLIRRTAALTSLICASSLLLPIASMAQEESDPASRPVVDSKTVQTVATPAVVGRTSTPVARSAVSAATAPQSQGVVTLKLEDIGLKQGIRLTGVDAAEQLYIPVNPDLQPVSLRLQVSPAPGLPPGRIWLSSGNRVLAALAVPETEQIWTVPLANAEITQGVMALNLRMVLEPKDYCAVNLGGWVQIGPTSEVNFTALNSPGLLVNQFFPPVLQDLWIVLPDLADKSAHQAVLTLSAALARRYSQPPRLHLLGSDAVLPLPGPFGRIVRFGGKLTQIVKEQRADKTELALLELGGDNLATAALALFGTPNALDSAAVTSITGISRIDPAENVLAEKVTLASLGQDNRQVRGNGTLAVPYRFSQSDLGGPVRELAVRLAGVHTPLIDGAQAYLSVSLGGVMFHSQKLSGTSFDLYAPVPASLVRRDNLLELSFQYTPPGGNCLRGAIPFSASVFNGSYLAVARGDALPAGFERFPQAFLPSFPVYLTELNLGNLSAASRLVMAMQRTTRTPLQPALVQTVPEAGPLLHVGQTGLAQAPLGLGPFALKDRLGRALVSYQPGSEFAVLQGFEQRLMLAGGTGLADTLLRQSLATDGWYGVAGDTAIQGIAGAPALLRIQGPGYVVEALAENQTSLWLKYRPWWFLLIGLFVILALAWAYPRAVRNTPPSTG
jgi:hypothetical protein